MGVPFIQQVRVGSYLLKQKLKRNRKYPLVLMLEPLYRCNLACSGCGKIDFPDHILNKRLSVKECIAAVEECGAPMVSIPGGEPLLHKEIDQIVAQLVKRKKFVYLCTNALLLEKNLHLFRPGRYLTFSVHLDGLKEHHDKAVNMEGGFEIAVSAIRAAKVAGFRVNVNCTLFDQMTADEAAEFFEFCTKDLKVEGITVSPGYAYERAEDQDNFLSREKTKNLFREIFRRGKGKKWCFSQSSIFLDFLAGNQRLACTPWSMPSRNVFGWQKPCYLIGEGYVGTWKELIDETDWNLYGTGNYEKCANCMTHCGYEGSAVQKSISNPLESMWVSLRGPKTEGPMVSEIDLDKARPAEYRHEQHILDAMNGVVLTKRDLRWFATRGSETPANESTEVAAKKSA